MNGILYLSRKDIETLEIPMKTVIQVVEDAFREKASAKVEVPPKPGIHPRQNAFIHAMPAWIPRMEAAGVKWVSGFPENPKQNLPYISGLLILNNPKTGLPISVMDCTWITAKRTGAATAVAAKYLAHPDSRVVGIIGCGVQGRSNLEALKLVCFNLEQVQAYDINKANLEKYVDEMKLKHRIAVTAANSPRNAVTDCDVVVTAGPILRKPKPIIEDSWLKPGGLACPLDFDSYWKLKTIQEMDKFYTDDKNQLEYYQKHGFIRARPPVYAELSELVTGKKPGRENVDERIMSMNLGLAIEDIATASLIYERAVQKKVGVKLPL
ncbi:MAG: ornithine cyclodeaminase family protein [Candidatus Bathyarchaeota archaeon]|nr:MAG: ornithine cyclodeaminase family protein [Candidatus Bathyarchaeota archaeon]